MRFAYLSRKPDNLLFHFDQGANYTSKVFMAYLKSLNIKQSFSKKATPHNNSVCETFFSTMKREELYRHDYSSEREFIRSVNNYMLMYNTKRPHFTLGYKTPDFVEEQYFKKQDNNNVDL